MNTEERKLPRTVKDKNLLSGHWRLKYKLVNRMGKEGFSGVMLSSYTDTVTGAPRHLYNEHGVRLPGYLVEHQVNTFKPDEVPQDRNVIDWLIGHPKVKIEARQAGLDASFTAKKLSNPRFELVNLDFEAIEDLEDEDFVDKVIGQISLDKGTNALGLDKLKFILSALNMQYNDLKYINDSRVEKQKLRKKLKDFTRKSKSNAEKVLRIIENLQNAKYEYEIKEMTRMEIIYISNGMYKYEGNPLGTTIGSVMKYFNNNPDFYAELAANLYSKLKAEKS